MADSYLQVPPDSTGKLIDTEEVVVGANTVQRQRVQITGAAAAAIVTVLTTNPASNDYGMVTRDTNAAAALTKLNTIASLIEQIQATAPAGDANQLQYNNGGSAFGGTPIAILANDGIVINATGVTDIPYAHPSPLTIVGNDEHGNFGFPLMYYLSTTQTNSVGDFVSWWVDAANHSAVQPLWSFGKASQQNLDLYFRNFTTGEGNAAILSTSLQNPGTGYAPDDTLSVSGGNNDAILTVAEINEGGAISVYGLTQPGTGYAIANNVSTGNIFSSGEGATINITSVAFSPAGGFRFQNYATDMIYINGADMSATFYGKITAVGGVDPPYVLFDKHTLAETVARVRQEVPREKHDGCTVFWSGTALLAMTVRPNGTATLYNIPLDKIKTFKMPE